MNDPRESNCYNKAYTVDLLGNVVGGSPCIYNNQSIDLLEQVAVASIKKGEPVWFGCEVTKRFASKQGIEDLTMQVQKFHIFECCIICAVLDFGSYCFKTAMTTHLCSAPMSTSGSAKGSDCCTENHV